mgnify:CR=1 FL=1
MEKIHVLLVEDEQTLAMIIKDTLEEQDLSLLPPEMVKKA